MTLRVIDNVRDIDKAEEDFKSAFCSKCANRYECMTGDNRMLRTLRDKFVLIGVDKKQEQVECYHYAQKFKNDNASNKQ